MTWLVGEECQWEDPQPAEGFPANIVTVPESPPPKEPPMGTTAKERNAVTAEIYGANRNISGSAFSGRRSLKKNLTPSARFGVIPRARQRWGLSGLHIRNELSLKPDHEHGGNQKEGESN